MSRPLSVVPDRSAPAPGSRIAAGAGERPFGLIGARYRLINELAHGGMGSVYRVLDRLTGRVVTLKRLRREPPSESGTASAASIAQRRALAEEFRLLTALRHPHVISVLDYGFDDERRPYFTMDLEENARTIIESGVDKPLAVQLDLLVQALRALVYVHRQGVIHRDLKPENILVVGDHVRVLDFGLSVYRHAAESEDIDWAGTPAYMAPEVLRGARPSARADLYAFGMVAYELLTGRYPFACDSQLLARILDTPLPHVDDVLDPRLRPILGRLLAKDPAARYEDASEVVAAIGAAFEQSFAVETVATRESFLHTAPMVGRERELATLMDALREAVRGRGGTWLVGGESGVGKSRLLEELRIRALVDGVVVVRGDAVNQGGGPYHVWREVLSHLVLRVEVGDTEASVLKAVVPHLSELVGREVADPPSTEPEAARSRLLLTVEQLIRKQPGPVLVILEDLQWVGSESLKLLAWLAQPATALPLLLVASFRDDEIPDLGKQVPEAHVLSLGRLGTDEIAALGESLIGPAGRRPDFVEFLEQETEGIPFFIVEVMRALAEASGRLSTVGKAVHPKRVTSGGMRKMIMRRLDQVPSWTVAPLRTAAVIERVIDTRLLGMLHPTLPVDEWIAACARASVIAVHDQGWRFAHDKLREHLLDQLSPESRRELHRRVAEAIERTVLGEHDHVTVLAHHWREAGEPAREAEYAQRAGALALENGACREAIDHLERVLELLRIMTAVRSSDSAGDDGDTRPSRRAALLDLNARVDLHGDALRLGLVESGLSEAYYRLGDLRNCRIHSERALTHLGQRVPSTRAGWMIGAARQVLLRAAQAALHVQTPPARRHLASTIARVELRLTDTFYYSLQLVPLLWSSLRTVNQCGPAGPSAELAQGYVILALLAGAVPLRARADRWAHRALGIAEGTGSERDVAWVLSRIGVLQLGTCKFADAEAGVGRAREIGERVGDLRLWAETSAQLGAVRLYSGRFEGGLAALREAHHLAQRSGDRQLGSWALAGQADVLVRLGRHEDAIPLYEAALTALDETTMRTEAISWLGMLALAQLRTGDRQAAYEAAERALWHIRTSKPVAYWTQHGMAATAEVLVTLVEDDWRPPSGGTALIEARAGQAIDGLRRFARHFPLGQPPAHLWAGTLASHRDRPRRARRAWKRALAMAESLDMPYEIGRAHLELGRHLPTEAHERRYHLDAAADVFTRLGSRHDLEHARAAVAHPPAGPRRTA